MHACVVSGFSHARLFVTLWTVAHKVPLSVGFSRQEYWSGLPCPPPGDLLHSESKPSSPASSALQADFLPTEPLGKPRFNSYNILNLVSHIKRKNRIFFHWEWSGVLFWWIVAHGIIAKGKNVCPQTYVRDKKWDVSILMEGSLGLGKSPLMIHS